MPLFWQVPLFLELLETLVDVEGSKDGVHSARGGQDVCGLAFHCAVEPHHSRLGRDDCVSEGLRYDTRVRKVPSLAAAQSSVPAALFFYNTLHMDPRSWLVPKLLQNFKSHNVADHSLKEKKKWDSNFISEMNATKVSISQPSCLLLPSHKPFHLSQQL